MVASDSWKAAIRFKNKDIFVKKKGGCWSKLNRLPYFNPVTHLPIVIMQNWLGCFLHHHFFYWWGFVIDSHEWKMNIKKKLPIDADYLERFQPNRHNWYMKKEVATQSMERMRWTRLTQVTLMSILALVLLCTVCFCQKMTFNVFESSCRMFC